ncbi:hypothetical protein [Endozoicomonas sp. 4G]|uniref:hypothetical protein n=1 Tax=Endozoicomonas sp. 4G TaxID=2872754 RepID=UPI002078B978|nr:hypothetical protein [Endozoicomonas sp. 4G]
MGNDEVETYRRRREPGDGRERTFASIASLVGALSLAWVLSSAWVGFRDSVLAELGACASRAELLGAKVEQYYRERDPWLRRIEMLEKQRDQLNERVQISLDRIRDLELGGGKRP